MNDTTDQAEKTANTPPPVDKRRNWILNIAGIILLVIAAVLYARTLNKNKEQAKAAHTIRMFGSTPIMNLGLHLDLHGSASNQVLLVNDPAIVSNITHQLTLAKPTDFPSSAVEGDEYLLTMVFTNHTVMVLRAARLYEDPDNLYVGARLPVEFDDGGKPVKWDFSRPALVIGLGKTFKELADERVPQMRANAPQFNIAMTNLIEQARIQAETAKAAGETGAENPASDIEAFMNATNTPASTVEQ